MSTRQTCDHAINISSYLPVMISRCIMRHLCRWSLGHSLPLAAFLQMQESYSWMTLPGRLPRLLFLWSLGRSLPPASFLQMHGHVSGKRSLKSADPLTQSWAYGAKTFNTMIFDSITTPPGRPVSSPGEPPRRSYSPVCAGCCFRTHFCIIFEPRNLKHHCYF